MFFERGSDGDGYSYYTKHKKSRRNKNVCNRRDLCNIRFKLHKGLRGGTQTEDLNRRLKPSWWFCVFFGHLNSSFFVALKFKPNFGSKLNNFLQTLPHFGPQKILQHKKLFLINVFSLNSLSVMIIRVMRIVSNFFCKLFTAR